MEKEKQIWVEVQSSSNETSFIRIPENNVKRHFELTKGKKAKYTDIHFLKFLFQQWRKRSKVKSQSLPQKEAHWLIKIVVTNLISFGFGFLLSICLQEYRDRKAQRVIEVELPNDTTQHTVE